MKSSSRSLIFVSNRLPVTIVRASGIAQLRPSSGGLVTALSPILHASAGRWVGWTGSEYDPEIERLVRNSRIENASHLEPVFLTEEERIGFYYGFCNEIVWPLFHDLQSRCNFDPAYWRSYLTVNRKYALATATVAALGDFVWVQDYHLMLLGKFLRELGLRCKLGFFQHIPFPPEDIFHKLPWRKEILQAMFDFDVIGFQTPHDQRNFAACVRRLLPEIDLRRKGEHLSARVGRREVFVSSFPIGIDFDEFAKQARSQEVAERAAQTRKDLAGTQIVLGVDRLDYTKGIPERLKAFQNLLATHPDLHRRITLVQVVVPSREQIPKYRELKLDIERLVSQINGQYGDPGWVPVHYIHRHLIRPELLALYRAADVALITPLKDGMNLVSKEFCAAQVEDAGVLILSEFAGAADQLGDGAILVNPYDIEGVAACLHQAFCMPENERRALMRRLRRRVRKENVFRWCESFCSHLGDLPLESSDQGDTTLLQFTAANAK
jgi:trehalose 6-phosphate synthase/phosphatase